MHARASHALGQLQSCHAAASRQARLKAREFVLRSLRARTTPFLSVYTVTSVFCARGPLPASPPDTDSLTSTSFTLPSNLWTARDTLDSCHTRRQALVKSPSSLSGVIKGTAHVSVVFLLQRHSSRY